MKQEEKNKLSREHIIESSISVFAKYKYEDASINSICRQYNISKGKMYHYYDSKMELYFSCIKYILNKLTDDMMKYEIKENLSIAENFHSYYESRIDYWIERPDSYSMIFSALECFTSKEAEFIQQEYDAFLNAMRDKTMEIVSSGNLNPEISIDNLFDVMRLVYERTFMPQLKKIIFAINEEVATTKKKELLSKYDKLIYIMLNGILNKK